jgi:hypothetical protein
VSCACFLGVNSNDLLPRRHKTILCGAERRKKMKSSRATIIKNLKLIIQGKLATYDANEVLNLAQYELKQTSNDLLKLKELISEAEKKIISRTFGVINI